jgi:long-subunit fatty acid transport protein
MAGSYITMNNDLNAMFINPAGMANLQQKNYSFNYTNYLLDINGGTAAYNHMLPGIGVLAVGVQYMNYGDFDYTNTEAVATGETFSAHDFALIVGLANHLSQEFSYGVNLKYVFSKIENFSASAVALDFGLIYKAPFVDDLLLALTFRNLGTNFSYYKKTKEQLPQSLRIGGSKKLAHLPLEISLSLNDITQDADTFADFIKRFSLGGEFRMSEMLRLRVGYDYDLQEGLSNETDRKFGGISAGAGINWKSFRFDYAYSNFSVLGNVHRFGISGTIN